MANFLKFHEMQREREIPPVVVISGRNAALVRAALDELLDRLNVAEGDITRMYAEETSARAVLVQCGHIPPFMTPQAIIYFDIEKAQGLGLLMKYAENPTTFWDPDMKHVGKESLKKTTLILVANEAGGKGVDRWLPSNEKTKTTVLYIDCSNSNADMLASYCQFAGLSESASRWLVKECGSNPEEVMRNLDILRVFVKPVPVAQGARSKPKMYWQDDLPEKVAGRLTTDILRFEQYAIYDSGSDVSLCVQLRTRLMQMLVLAVHAPQRITIPELILRAEIDNWVFTKVFALAKSKPPQVWLDRLWAVTEAEHYARQDMPGVREYLAAYL